MKNIFEAKAAKIIAIKEQAPGVKSFTLEFVNDENRKDFFFFPGQFLMISLSGYGEAPVGISSDPNSTGTFEICVRAAGRLTKALHKRKEGEIVGIRGPLGKGAFPMKGVKNKNLVLVAGGIGIIPLRSVVLDIMKNPGYVKKAQLFYGSKCIQDLLYEDEFPEWKKVMSISLTVDEKLPGDCNLVCDEGLITKLLETKKVLPEATAFVVGPPVMCKAVIELLVQKGIKEDDIHISLERNMQCGVGECHHCGIGDKLVCKDGPVFRYSDIKSIPGAI